MFLKKLTVLAAVVSAAAGFINAQVSFGDARLFNDGWQFSLGDDTTAVAPAYNDSLWRKLQLPHDWSVEQPASPYLASCTGYLPGGIGWYRRYITLLNKKVSQIFSICETGYFNLKHILAQYFRLVNMQIL